MKLSCRVIVLSVCLSAAAWTSASLARAAGRIPGTDWRWWWDFGGGTMYLIMGVLAALVERQASGFVGSFARLTQHEPAIVRFQRPIINRQLAQLMIAHVDPDGVEA